MSGLTRSRRPARGLDLGDHRQGVNLLPMSVRTARDARLLRARLIAGLIALAVIVTVADGVVLVLQDRARSDVEATTAEATRLRAELSSYAEVSDLRQAIERTTTAREGGMATEIRWVDLIARIEAVAPAGTTVTSFSSQAAAPGETTPGTPDDLTHAGIGTIDFTLSSPTLPDTAAWLDALNGIPGLMDAAFTTASMDAVQTGDGEIYTVTSTVQVNVAALSRAYLGSIEQEDTP